MAAPRKSSSLLEFTGSYKKDPARRRQDVVCSKPLGKAPKQTLMSVADAWKYFAKVAPPGTLTARDRPVLEIVCTLWAEFRNSPDTMHIARLSRMTALIASLGLTPVDSRRVTAEKPPERDDWD